MSAAASGPGTAPTELAWRAGHGYDLHRLEALPPLGRGRPLVVGGVRLSHDRGPVSHSDGDALLHAITDAILGALGAPDIGQLFPDTDPAHESQDSAQFLRHAADLAARAGWTVANLDCTVVLERPRVAPHKDAMRRAIAAAIGVPADRVNVKAKTHEGVDAVGEGRAIEAHAVVLLARRIP